MQKQQDNTPQNSDCQHRSTTYQCATLTNQKKRVLDRRDEGESLTYQYSISTTRPVSLNRGSADFPTCRRIGTLPRSRKVQHGRLGVSSRLGVSRGSTGVPLPSKTETVSASRKTHTIVQTSLSRRPDYPASMRSKQDHSRRRLISEGPFTRSVQQNPHSGEDAVGHLPPVWGGATPTENVGA